MLKKLMTTLGVLGLVVGLTSLCFAANIRIAATIGEAHQMNVTLLQVVDTVQTPVSDLSGLGMDFGPLTRGGDGVYRSNRFFIVDAPVISNKTGWTITITRADFARDTTNNLNANTNVRYMKVDNVTNAETALSNSYVSYANSARVVQQSELTGGTGGSRLRVYYAIALGSGDATGVSTITDAKPTGSYAGSVTLTLSP